MRQDIPLLDNVRVAAPCPANWNEMVGGERVRYCRACEKNVYNLSEMTRKDAEELLETHEGRLCIRYYQRADGKIITQNCPAGLRAQRRSRFSPSDKTRTYCKITLSILVYFSFIHYVLARQMRHAKAEMFTRLIEARKEMIATEKFCLSDKKRNYSEEDREAIQRNIRNNHYEIEKDLQNLRDLGE